MKRAARLLLFGAMGVVAAPAAWADAPEGIQEIADLAFNMRPPGMVKTCAYWANEAAAAVRKRDQGMSEEGAQSSVSMPKSIENPTDEEVDLYSRRAEVVAQVYEDDDLQRMSSKRIHDAVFDYCRSNSK